MTLFSPLGLSSIFSISPFNISLLSVEIVLHVFAVVLIVTLNNEEYMAFEWRNHMYSPAIVALGVATWRKQSILFIQS